jgi:hypothetical protein
MIRVYQMHETGVDIGALIFMRSRWKSRSLLESKRLMSENSE